MKNDFENSELSPFWFSRVGLRWVIAWIVSLALITTLLVNQYVYKFIPISETQSGLFVFLSLISLIISMVIIIANRLITRDEFIMIILNELLKSKYRHHREIEFEKFSYPDIQFMLWDEVDVAIVPNLLEGEIESLKEDIRQLENMKKSQSLTKEDEIALSLALFKKRLITGRTEMIRTKKKELAENNKSKIQKMITDGSLKVLIAHPKLISKRFTSPFLVEIYDEKLESKVVKDISFSAREEPVLHIYTSNLKAKLKIKVKLASPTIVFSESVSKQINSGINKISFLAKPTDLCESGKHQVLLTITDFDTGLEYHSWNFHVHVVDYVFDHVSRPLLSKATTFVLSIGSFAMFVLTFLEQVDKTIGLTSGTAAFFLAAMVYGNFYNLYQRVRPNMP